MRSHDRITARAALAVLVSLFASAAGAAAVRPLATYTGAAGFRIDGAADSDRSGFSVASAGDVNGDGIDDIVIGAIGADPNGSSSGSAYVVFGTAAGVASPFALSSLDGSNGFRLDGAAADDRAGASVAGIGDLDGDGIADLVVGAPGLDTDGANAGGAYVVFGRTTAFPAAIALASLDGATGFRVDGAAAGDEAGGAVAAAGDVNDDGVADLVIGARGADPNGERSGASFVLFGRATGGFAAAIPLAALDGATGFRVNGAAAGEESGADVAGAGDLDHDGIDDIAIGAPFADPSGDFSGSTYVVYGRATAFGATIDAAALDGATGFRIDGVAFNDRSGSAVSGAGDLNGDGVADLAIGAFAAEPSAALNASGSTFVVFGRAQGGFAATLPLSTLDGTNGYRIDGAAAGDVSGRAVSAGDVNGDGTDDLAIGADLADPSGSESGSSYLVFGAAGPASPQRSLASTDGRNGVRFDGVAAFDHSGYALARAGDFNDDGIEDLLIGAELADPNGSASGSTWLVYGNAAPLRAGAATTPLAATFEDAGPGGATTLAGVLAAKYLDLEPLAGAAVTANPTATSGTWEYSTDAGASWNPLPASLSASAALVLATDAQLRFVPAANFSGDSAPLVVRMWDGADGYTPGAPRDIASSIGSLGGFSNDANTVSLVVPVLPVNDAPSFAASDPPPAVASGAEIVVPAWALFSAGPPSESSQAVDAYLVGGVSNPSLFTQLPSVGPDGTLRYTPAAGMLGSSTFAVRVRDNGGTDNGGVDLSAQQTFTITLVNALDPIFEDGFE